jgi:sarcosine oxidase
MKRRDFINQTLGTTLLATAPSLSMLSLNVNEKIEKSRNDNVNYDVIVLGVGSMGSSTCYHLAKQGYKVLGLEQFDIPHELGSHAGQSRMIRKAYGEHPDYVPLLERAYQNWKTLETETGVSVYFKTGVLYFGESSNSFLKGVLASSEKYSIQVNSLSKALVSKKYPQFTMPNDFKCLEEPDGKKFFGKN